MENWISTRVVRAFYPAEYNMEQYRRLMGGGSLGVLGPENDSPGLESKPIDGRDLPWFLMG